MSTYWSESTSSIIVMVRWTGLAPCEFEFLLPGCPKSTFLLTSLPLTREGCFARWKHHGFPPHVHLTPAGGKACLSIRKHDHLTPTRKIRRHIRALARNHPECSKRKQALCRNKTVAEPIQYDWATSKVQLDNLPISFSFSSLLSILELSATKVSEP